jgi:hypothetical protein
LGNTHIQSESNKNKMWKRMITIGALVAAHICLSGILLSPLFNNEGILTIKVM